MECFTRDNLETRLGVNANRVKAALLIIVAIDHNDWFRQLAPKLFEPLTFHVLGFFLLAFTFGTKAISIRFISDRIARYLIPFWWALTAASLAFFLMYRGAASPIDSVIAWALAAVIGNAPFVKSASGLLMMWFLPCLFGLSCLLALFDSLQSSRMKHLAVGLALVAHLAIPLLPRFQVLCFPFGFAIALNIFILGLIWRKMLKCQLPCLWGPSVAVGFVVSYGALVSAPVHIEIAELSTVGIDHPFTMILQDVAGMSGVLTVVWLVGIPRQLQWFDEIGKNSLLVYLFHPVAYVVLGKLMNPIVPIGEMGGGRLFLFGSITTGVAVGLAVVASVLLSRSALFSAWITPRSWGQWAPVRFLSKRG